MDERLATAMRFGATAAINSGKANVVEEILKLTNGDGADIAFEAVGVTATVESAISCARKGGSVTLVGNLTPKIDFPLQIAVTRELTIHGSCASRGEYPACLDMLARGDLDPAPLLSASAPLSEGASWFDRLYRRETGLLKVILKP